MATNDKEQVIVALEGEINNLKELNELARERGFKTPLAAMIRNLKQAEAKFAEIPSLASVDGEMRNVWQLTTGGSGGCYGDDPRHRRAAR
jgi:hypothetical protein